jgi:hypothetical protein
MVTDSSAGGCKAAGLAERDGGGCGSSNSSGASGAGSDAENDGAAMNKGPAAAAAAAAEAEGVPLSVLLQIPHGNESGGGGSKVCGWVDWGAAGVGVGARRVRGMYAPDRSSKQAKQLIEAD